MLNLPIHCNLINFIISSTLTLSARSYPRHACPLYVVVFMQVHDISKSPPLLAGRGINDPFGIMRIHAA